MTHYYKEVDGVPTPCEFEDAPFGVDRHVAKSTIGNADVSTVFLVIDHAFFSAEAPVLYETMIFGGVHDQWQDRYHTRDYDAAPNVTKDEVREDLHAAAKQEMCLHEEWTRPAPLSNEQVCARCGISSLSEGA